MIFYWERGGCDEVCHFYSKDRRPAKKEHKCIECGNVIPAGIFYYSHAGKWGAEFKSWSVCLECETDWMHLMTIFEKGGIAGARIIYGEIKEAIQDAIEAKILLRGDPFVVKWLGTIEEESEFYEAHLVMKQMTTFSRPLL